MIELVFEVITESLFQYPGAFIRWIFLHKKRTFKSLINTDSSINTGITFLLIIIIVVIITIVNL